MGETQEDVSTVEERELLERRQLIFMVNEFRISFCSRRDKKIKEKIIVIYSEIKEDISEIQEDKFPR
jgi:hypothetical protein